jgi:hypothetical protein
MGRHRASVSFRSSSNGIPCLTLFICRPERSEGYLFPPRCRLLAADPRDSSAEAAFRMTRFCSRARPFVLNCRDTACRVRHSAEQDFQILPESEYRARGKDTPRGEQNMNRFDLLIVTESLGTSEVNPMRKIAPVKHDIVTSPIQFPIVCLLLLLASTFVSAEPRQSQFKGRDLNHLLEKYQGVTVELQPDKPRYVLGQFIFLEYHIICTVPRKKPWDVLDWTILMRNGIRTGWERFGEPLEGTQIGSKNTEFVGTTQTNGRFFDTDLTDSLGFDIMAPGSYVGYFDRGILSQDFSFVIESAPDSLLSRWSRYCVLRRIGEGAFRGHEYSALDSTSEIMQEFMALPEGSLWRKEALVYGAYTYAIANFWVPLRTTDTTFLVSVLFSLADEHELPALSFLGAAQSLCERPTSEATAEALIEFAQRLGKPEILNEAYKWRDYEIQIREEREQQQKRKRVE